MRQDQDTKTDAVITIRQIEALQHKADEALNAEIERRMRAIFAKHKSLGCLLKCMGEITAYSAKDGCSFGFWREEPKFMRPLHNLAEMDLGYYSRTGRPLKLYRLPDGSIHETRDW